VKKSMEENKGDEGVIRWGGQEGFKRKLQEEQKGPDYKPRRDKKTHLRRT